MKRLIVATVCAGLVLAIAGDARAGPFCGKGLRGLLPRNWPRNQQTQQAPMCGAFAPQPPNSIHAPLPP